MLRPWLTCAAVTAIVVAMVLASGRRRWAGSDPTVVPEAPPPPTEQEIRVYIELQPAIMEELGALAAEFHRAHAGDGRVGDEAGFRIKPSPRIDALLAARNLTREGWDRLRRCVEGASVK